MKGKIFNTQEVQDMIAGNKRMFREVCKRQPQGEMQKPYVIREMGIGRFHYPFGECAYQVGQKIFCKEKFCRPQGEVLYRADFQSDQDHEWWAASYMTKWASRLTLQIKEIRVEKLSEISEEDAIAEGNYLDRCECLPRKKDKSPIDAMFKQNWCHIHGQEFKDAWNATHKKPEEKFEANPLVWVCTMEVVK